jgi:ribosomal protein S18 acetylase RimI-like enzyme
MPDLRSRIAGTADLPALLPMMEQFNTFEQIPCNEETTERSLRTLLDNRSLGVVALLYDDNASVGYVVVTWGFDLEWDGRDAFLTELYIVPEARGCGLGGRALEAAEVLSREHGARALHLMYRTENVVAGRLSSPYGPAATAKVNGGHVVGGATVVPIGNAADERRVRQVPRDDWSTARLIGGVRRT